MTTDERVLAEIAQTNPLPDPGSPTPQERAQAERILQRVLADAATAPPRRARPGVGMLVPVASLLVVVGVAALILRTGGSGTSASSATGGQQISLVVQPTSRTSPVSASAMSREIAVMRRRLATLGRGYTVTQSGANRIVVTLPNGRAAQPGRIDQLITQPAHLYFYDWEANVLTPNGKTAASQLLTQDPAALAVSQGGNQGGAGTPGPGSMSLYAAVTLAAKQPTAPASSFLSRLGPAYYMFGAPGSSACAAAARGWGAPAPPPGRCLLAGPVSAASRAEAIDSLTSEVPLGVNASDGQVRAIPQGTVILQAAASELNAAAPVPIFSPKARFFVLRDHVALTGTEITHPRAGTDQGGEPDITFGFTGPGRGAFQGVTKALAHRGSDVSSGNSMLYQHFAVALDNQLLTVPQIDFRIYPDGIIGAGGADITGGFTRQSARDVASELRYGTLPLAVRVMR